jgi:hypothetical protein
VGSSVGAAVTIGVAFVPEVVRAGAGLLGVATGVATGGAAVTAGLGVGVTTGAVVGSGVVNGDVLGAATVPPGPPLENTQS